MYSSIILQRSRIVSDLFRTRLLTRLMGGGPRTFPGGINKWQWKRLHEKRAKEKEKRLLEQEKQLYQARIRSQIRANIAGGPNPGANTSSHSPMSPEDQIKALANRFVREGAEDLWNEKDGPLKLDPPKPNKRQGSVAVNQRQGSVAVNQRRGAINSPLDLRKLMLESSNVGPNHENASHGYNWSKVRDYSVGGRSDFNPKSENLLQKQRRFRRNESSPSDDKLDYGFVYNSVKGFAGDSEGNHNDGKKLINVGRYVSSNSSFAEKNRGFQRNERSLSDDSDSEDTDLEDDRTEGRRGVKGFGSRAALGNYDVKRTKRVPLKKLEEIEFAEEVESLRLEFRRKKLVENEEEKVVEGADDSILSNKRFDECGISPMTVKALSTAGFVQMTRVQEATLSVCLEGKDAIVKAKTGTGKTAAFLLPAIEAALKSTSNANSRVRPVYVLILCPTRELASQIAAQANALLKYHDGIGVLTLVGGTRFKVDQKRLESDPSQILVATPGRLLDHIENKGGLRVHLMGLKMVILDEADHLLDLGFRKDLEKIVDCLPRQRQSLLFSATIPKEVRRMSQLVLKRDHTFIDTVGLACVETPAQIKQSVLVVPQELQFQVAHHILREHIMVTPDYKVIVFCTTGMVASLLYLLLREMKMNVREMHSRKPQLYRDRVSVEFRESRRLVLVTSDVSARGMHYPDVTLVIQVGIPADRELYIHRIGRTGREGKDGEGVLLLAPWEEYFLDELKDLPAERVPLPQLHPETKLQFEESLSRIDGSVKEAAYHAWLGYYNSIKKIGRDKTTLVELANRFCGSIGLQKPPPLFRKTALKMGLKDIPGIRIRN